MDFVLLNSGIPMEIYANIQGIPKIISNNSLRIPRIHKKNLFSRIRENTVVV